MAKTTDPLDATLRQAADYFGCDRDWLGAQVSEAGLRPVRAHDRGSEKWCLNKK